MHMFRFGEQFVNIANTEYGLQLDAVRELTSFKSLKGELDKYTGYIQEVDGLTPYWVPIENKLNRFFRKKKRNIQVQASIYSDKQVMHIWDCGFFSVIDNYFGD